MAQYSWSSEEQSHGKELRLVAVPLQIIRSSSESPLWSLPWNKKKEKKNAFLWSQTRHDDLAWIFPASEHKHQHQRVKTQEVWLSKRLWGYQRKAALAQPRSETPARRPWHAWQIDSSLLLSCNDIYDLPTLLI